MPKSYFSTDHANLLHKMDNAETEDQMLVIAKGLREYRRQAREDAKQAHRQAYTPTATEAYEMLSNSINDYSEHLEEFGKAIDNDHRSLQQKMYGLFFGLIQRFATQECGGTDGRNQCAKDTCIEIFKACRENGVYLGKLPTI